MPDIRINLPQESYSYSVRIGTNTLEQHLEHLLQERLQTTSGADDLIFCITNSTIGRLHGNRIRDFFAQQKNWQLRLLEVQDGEEHKNYENVLSILDFLLTEGGSRKSLLLAFGGGVIGDMAGFAAAIFNRGIDFVLIPTTLLSQVDSSIGGKTGINHRLGSKNAIGVFKQPLQTIIDLSFLQTLPERELVAGYAELIKHGCIQSSDLFSVLEQESNSLLALLKNADKMSQLIQISCSIKAQVVEEDEKEGGKRAILNFGHTLAHLLESHTGYNTYLHGECVIVGMDFATYWSHRKGVLSAAHCTRIREHLAQIPLPKMRVAPMSKEQFIEYLIRDKKRSGRGLTFVELETIGAAVLRPHQRPEDIYDLFCEYTLRDDSLLLLPKERQPTQVPETRATATRQEVVQSTPTAAANPTAEQHTRGSSNSTAEHHQAALSEERKQEFITQCLRLFKSAMTDSYTMPEKGILEEVRHIVGTLFSEFSDLSEDNVSQEVYSHYLVYKTAHYLAQILCEMEVISDHLAARPPTEGHAQNTKEKRAIKLPYGNKRVSLEHTTAIHNCIQELIDTTAQRMPKPHRYNTGYMQYNFRFCATLIDTYLGLIRESIK